ncbi:lantibiotic immunity ABC transporter MutE/EpiE family permease subunit [Paenibacillus caui]|uniref:lantibiotic immunity ABC transporter MutE/EpiE family permease subunit n=1 Tax=Paenibacillus caui TaxID=2873927 RepID=UPI001CA8E3A6|nr:lantibiotic immunity ABC transporter MutE/EpiE family permease subunit [Paenibacillus caui]
MLHVEAAEYLKLKRTFTKKLIWLAPLVTMLLCAGLGVSSLFQSGSYNWWYSMMLPGALTLICAGVLQKDGKKLNYRAILGLPVRPSRFWIGKIGVAVRLLLTSSIVFFAGVTLGGFVFTSTIPFANSAAGSLLLFITFLWQIPLCLFLTERLGMFATLIINLAGYVACGIFSAQSSLWWALPYAIPSRLMCPVIGVLPNGLPVPAGDPLLDKSVILPGIIISVFLFVVLSLLTAWSFRNREVK